MIDDDMGTMDACLAAIVACLRKTRVPDATTTSTKKEDTKRTNDDGTKEKKKERKMLEVNRSFKPVCLTVGAFNLSSHNNDGDTTGNNFNSKKRKMDTEEEKEKDTNKENEEEEEIEDYVPPKQIVVVDPTYEETKLCNALIHVIVDENGNVLGLEQSHDGASEVDETVLAKAIAAAKLRHGEVWKRIEQFDEMKEEEDEDEGEKNYLLLFYFYNFTWTLSQTTRAFHLISIIKSTDYYLASSPSLRHDQTHSRYLLVRYPLLHCLPPLLPVSSASSTHFSSSHFPNSSSSEPSFPSSLPISSFFPSSQSPRPTASITSSSDLNYPRLRRVSSSKLKTSFVSATLS